MEGEGGRRGRTRRREFKRETLSFMFKDTLFVSETLGQFGSSSQALIGGATEPPVSISASGSDNVAGAAFQGYAEPWRRRRRGGGGTSRAPSQRSVHVIATDQHRAVSEERVVRDVLVQAVPSPTSLLGSHVISAVTFDLQLSPSSNMKSTSGLPLRCTAVQFGLEVRTHL